MGAITPGGQESRNFDSMTCGIRASWHVMSGTHLQELMELGGWKSFEMVLRYAHLAPEHLAKRSQANRASIWDDVVEVKPYEFPYVQA